MNKRDGAGDAARLGRTLTAFQFFTLGFGAIIGVAWVVVLGDWLDQAGPVGAIMAFIGGSVVMLLICLCYAEVGTMIPVAGGEIAYTCRIFGLRSAYAVGWLLTLAYIGIVAFEGISAGWIIGALVPGIEGIALYSVGGDPVQIGSLLIGLAGTMVLTLLNYRGIRAAATLQSVLTYLFIGLATIFIGTGLLGGEIGHVQPWFRESPTGAIAWSGVLGLFVTAPMWFSGFNVIPQVMEERAPATALRTVARVMITTVSAAAVFYVLVILSASMAMPWQQLVLMELPAAAAFRSAFASEILGNVVLLAALAGILTTWNTMFIAASRVLFAFGRAQIIMPQLGKVHATFGSPDKAAVFVGLVGAAGIFLGRGALLPIVNVGASCLAFAYLLTCLGMIRLRRIAATKPRPYCAPGGVAIGVAASAGALFMLVMTLYLPYAKGVNHAPLEWALLLLWVAVGVTFWIMARKHRDKLSESRRANLMFGAITDNVEEDDSSRVASHP